MRIGPIALKLRIAKTRFGDLIGGAAELAYALAGTLTKEVAFVIQLAETVDPNTYDSGINQKISERFGVIVALDNATSDRDKTGLTAYDTLFEIRTELFAALLGWQMPGAEDLVSYGGGRILGIDRARLWYQFEFVAGTRISDEDGVDSGVEALEDFDTIYAQYVLTPSADLPAGGIPVEPTTFMVDMTAIVDFTSNPDVDGAFGSGFGIGFDTYKP